MKSFKHYILEELDTYRVKDLVVPYKVISDTNKDYLIFKVPDIYSEDDFQIYLQDLYLKDLPGDESHIGDFFGKNISNLFDVLFEYEKYIKSYQNPGHFIDFDINYDDKVKDNKDIEFAYVKLIKLRYILKFDEFDLNSENLDNIQNDLITIFKNCESNDKNKWGLTIKLDEENIEYK